ncbi:MAG TPA: STAS domain-containing protein [Gaiellales bacterium]|nr:STAS domain-containing protein [Gaiellales bacterium]
MQQAGLGSIELEQVNRVAVVALRGEHDLLTARLLEDALTTAGATSPVVVDLCDAAFIDSSTIGVLIAHSDPADSGLRWSRLALVMPPEGFVTHVLRLVAIDQRLPIFQQVSHAIAAVQMPAEAA